MQLSYFCSLSYISAPTMSVCPCCARNLPIGSQSCREAFVHAPAKVSGRSIYVAFCAITLSIMSVVRMKESVKRAEPEADLA